VATFYFDLASPLSYLASERVLGVLPGPARWQPVLEAALVPPLKGLVGDAGGSTAREALPVLRSAGGERGEDEGPAESVPQLRAGGEALRAEVERRAQAQGLQPVRWPEPFPFDSSFAMRVATYACSIGRGVPFAQAAFRQAYAGGRNLEEQDNVLIAAAACEMHPRAVLAGARLRSTDGELRVQTVRAARAGVRTLPAVVVDGQVFAGDAALERAATHMRASARATASG
jgi:2-hydroxychromene-2-carboxylate isomerase